MTQSKTVLIIGGAGYIGSHMVYFALDHGWKVVVIDNLSRGRSDIIPKEVQFVNADICDFDKINYLLNALDYDVVMHFAAFAYVGESIRNPAAYYKNNVVGTINLVNALLSKKKTKLVFSSTCATYGEVCDQEIVEKTPQNPINPYGRTKKIVEDLLRDYQNSGQALSYICLRYFNAAGCDMKGRTGEYHDPETHLIPLALKSASDGSKLHVFGNDFLTKDGTCVRDYIHVEDLCSAHLLAAERLLTSENLISEEYNLGNGSGYSVLEIIEAVERVTGKRVNYEFSDRRPGDPGYLVASSEKAKRELGWNNKFSDIDLIIKSAWNMTKREGVNNG